MKEIILTRGKVALVDDEDFDNISKSSWHCTKNGYAAHGVGDPNKKRKTNIYLMHRELLSAPKGLDVDHVNGDKLDNRRINLRLCKHSDSTKNIGFRKNVTSEYKGVHWDKAKQKWCARIKINYKHVFFRIPPRKTGGPDIR